jgi:hypothetical protein
MAKREIKKGVCSFCLAESPYKEMYTVRMPMHTFADGSTRDVYQTICCSKCINKKDTKERILEISEEPKSKKS